MKIAVVSFYGVTNIGDKILTDTVCWILKKKGHHLSIVDINARYVYRYSNILGKIEKKIVSVFIKRNTENSIINYFEKSFRDKDLILFAGGQIIDMAYTNCCLNIYRITKIAELLGIPIAYNAVGLAGDLYDNKKGEYLKYALSSRNVISITARERISDINNFLIAKNSPCKASWVCDTAVWCNDCYGIYRNELSKIVGINIISEENINAYYKGEIDPIDIYVAMYRMIKAKGYQCLFFTNGVPRDMDTVNKILKELRLPAKNHILLPSNTMKGRSFIKMLSSFSFIVSSRLHTSICAYSLKIPTIAFSWDNKIQTFYANIGCPERCLDILRLSSDMEYFNTTMLDAISNGYDENLYNNCRESIFGNLSSINKWAKK